MRIKLTNGKVGQVRIDKLSAADQEFSKQASLALEEAEELLVMEEEPRAAPTVSSNVRNKKEQPDADATSSAWNSLQETIEKCLESQETKASAWQTKFAFLLSRVSLRNVDPDLKNLFQRHIASHQKNAKAFREYEQELDQSEAKWRAEAKELESEAEASIAAAGSPQEAQQGLLVLLSIFGTKIEAGRKSDWEEINKRYSGLFEASNAELKALLDAEGELAAELEVKYGVPFVKVTP